MSIFDIIQQLELDNSRLAKEKILTDNKNNKLLQRVFFLALDPFTQFYIRKIPEYIKNDKPTLDFGYVLDQLSKLSSRKVTGNAGIEHLTNLLSQLEEDDAKILERIIGKDLKCGVSEKTANKIWKNLIPEYPCMLASGFDQKLVDKIQWPALVQLKLDGMRFNAIVRKGTVEFRSRNGKELNIPNKVFEESFIQLMKHYGTDMVFDGELLVVDSFGKPVNRQTGNGILSKSIKGTMSEAEATDIRATLWDAISIDGFTAGKEDEIYKHRFAKLSNAISHVKGIHRQLGHCFDLVWSQKVENITEAQKVFERFLLKGEEGTILKDYNTSWEGKRSKSQIKFKGELDCDLICVDWEEGTGKNRGRLGALVLESACGQLRTNVGTGFTDEHRDMFTRGNSVGKIVSVKYNSKIQDKGNNGWALFLPVFLEIREDKNIADRLDKIK
jgi:ATP-dependent DNA ligase